MVTETIRSGYKQTEVGVIPEDWELGCLGNLTGVNMGHSPASGNYNERQIGIPLIQGNADIKKRKSIHRIWTTQTTKKCDKGDIILTVRAPVGSVAIASEASCIGRGVCSLKPKSLKKEYLFHYLIFHEDDWRILEQGSTFTAANSDQIRGFEVVYPVELDEQTAIAQVLSGTDELIESLNKLITKKKNIKQGAMQELLTGKRRLPGFSGEWEPTKLGDICIKIQDGNYGESYPKSYEFVQMGVPFLTSKAIGKDGVLKEKLIDFITIEKHQQLTKAHIEYEDVLFTNRGASVGAIGYVTSKISGGNIGPQLTLLRSDNEKVLPRYLFQVLKSDNFKKQITGKDSGSAMNFFGIEQTKKFQLTIPITTKEQSAIAQVLSDMDAEIELLERKRDKYLNLKAGMMQQLLTGRIRLI